MLGMFCLGLAARAGEENQLRNLAGVPVTERNPVALDLLWPTEVGQAVVCLWKDDKLAAFSITIDDNTKPDHAWWLEQGKKYRFRFTWFVITKALMEEKNPGFTGTWADFQALAAEGHDIQSHSVTHRSKELNVPVADDYSQAIDHIQTNIPGAPCLTLAYPGGGLPNDPAVAAQYYAGARGTVAVPNGPSPNYLEVTSVGSADQAFIEPGQPRSWASLLGLVERHEKNPAKYRGWYCMHFHGVQWNEKSRETILPPLVKLLDHVKEQESKFWVAPFREVILYGQERDTAHLSSARSGNGEIRFTLTDRMYDAWYDFPLTIKVRIPNEWATVRAIQGEKPLTSTVVEHAGQKYALIGAVPDRGEVVVTSAASP